MSREYSMTTRQSRGHVVVNHECVDSNDVVHQTRTRVQYLLALCVLSTIKNMVDIDINLPLVCLMNV